MPIYDYKCPKCGKTTEELVKTGEVVNFYCEECKVKMERQFPDSVSFRMTDSFIMGRDKPPEPEIAKKLDQIKTGEIPDPYGKWRDKA